MGTLFPTISEILTESDLQRLREGYDRKAMADISERAFDFFPPAVPYAHLTVDTIYRSEELSPKDRERMVITLLTAKHSSFPLAVHCYWGMMEGLSVREIGTIMYVTAAYSGIDVLACGGKVFTRTLTELKQLVSSTQERITSPQVLKFLATAFD